MVQCSSLAAHCFLRYQSVDRLRTNRDEELKFLTILPRAFGENVLDGSLRAVPSHFLVSEQLGFSPIGDGEHQYLQIRKCHLNTHDVLERLQEAFRCGSADIGVSGLKDKNAITDQWISIRSPLQAKDVLPGDFFTQSDAAPEPGRFAVLQHARHTKKLRRGAHQSNAFVITLSNLIDLSASKKNRIEHRLNLIAERGFPNYFGPQRFGNKQRNLVLAKAYFRQPRKKISRTKRGLILSAARSSLFNLVCATRVQQDNWWAAIPGEVLSLDGTRSFFSCDIPDKEIEMRLASFDIHPTGPMWGRGASTVTGQCAQLEDQALETQQDFCIGLENAGLKQERRSLRARPEAMSWQWSDEQHLVLRFNLATGVYATSLLSELGQFTDTSLK